MAAQMDPKIKSPKLVCKLELFEEFTKQRCQGLFRLNWASLGPTWTFSKVQSVRCTDRSGNTVLKTKMAMTSWERVALQSLCLMDVCNSPSLLIPVMLI